MKRHYPYLQDRYFTNVGTEDKIARSILEDIENFANQRQYVRLTLLDWQENPLKEIQGEISSGSLSKNASSPVRRSGNLTCAVNAGSYSVDDMKAEFAINKKIFIEIGIRNDTKKYSEYPIFWFPEGVFFIGSFSINSSASGTTNISLTLKDKMAMLNGDVGGTLPAAVTFDVMDTQLPDGTIVIKKVPIVQIIQELVNHYGKESLANIVIEDVPKRIRRVLKWNGTQPLYMQPYIFTGQEDLSDLYDNTIEGYAPLFTLEKVSDKAVAYYNGDDIGYDRQDFVITNELAGNAGESVCAILDKIVNILGNYEYFYDVFGVFHFREIKNYLNHTLGENALSKLGEKDYLIETNNSKSVFAFNDKTLLTSITVTPQYENIKNDYIILGMSQTETGANRQVMYHLAIDKKPSPIGIDNRDQIYSLKDRTEDIAAANEDINTLNDEFALARRERSQIKTLINTQEKKREQRLIQLKKYGDLLKVQLAETLGDWAYPTEQKISNITFDSKTDFYPGYEEAYLLEIKNQEKEDIEFSQYLCDTDKKMLEYAQALSNLFPGENRNEIIINNNNENQASLNFTQSFWNILTPEGYWKIIKAKYFDSIPLDQPDYPDGLLQYPYFAKLKQNEYAAALAWREAKDLLLQNTLVAFDDTDFNSPRLKNFDSLKNNAQNKETGYKKINSKTIQTNEKKLIQEPITPVALKVQNELPEWIRPDDIPKWTQGNQPASAHSAGYLFPDYDNFGKIAIANIYSDFYTLLPDSDNFQKKQYQENLNLAIGQINILTNKLRKISELINNFGIDSVDTKYQWGNNVDDYYAIQTENDNNINHNLQYKTTAEKEQSTVKKELENLVKIKNDTEAKLKILNEKTQEKKYKEIWDNLNYYWELYNNEKELILQIEDIISTRTTEWNTQTVITKGKLLELINSFKSKGYYFDSKTSPTVKTIIVDEILNEWWPSGSDITVGKDIEIVYPTIIQKLQDIIEHWQIYFVYEKIDNPRKGEEYYGVYSERSLVLYEEPDTQIVKAGFVYQPFLDNPNYDENDKQTWLRPEVGNFNLIYPGEAEIVSVSQEETKINLLDSGYYYWDGSSYKPLNVKGVYWYNAEEKNNNIDRDGYAYYIYDWRTLLYLKGIYATILGTDTEYYYPELEAFWPMTYDLVNQCFKGQMNSGVFDNKRLTEGYYFLDFLDPLETTFGVWSIDNIGRRTDVVVNDEINCLFEPEVPNVNILNATSIPIPTKRLAQEEEWTLAQLRQESIDEGEPYTQVSDEIYDNIVTGGYRNSAYEQLKYELYLHTRYQKSISASAIPVFYLEPNSRVTITDTVTNTFGDFIIQNISLTFGPGANMSISATETLERF